MRDPPDLLPWMCILCRCTCAAVRRQVEACMATRPNPKPHPNRDTVLIVHACLPSTRCDLMLLATMKTTAQQPAVAAPSHGWCRVGSVATS